MKRENASALFRVVFRTYGRKSRFARRTIKTTNTRALFVPRVFSFTLLHDPLIPREIHRLLEGNQKYKGYLCNGKLEIFPAFERYTSLAQEFAEIGDGKRRRRGNCAM